jgi:lycopene beta-cyclase
MDFRVSQEAGIHFIYLLPFSETLALIESTVYSTELLPTSWYETQIKGYIKQNFPGLGWELINKEYGAIPLNNKFQQGPYGVPIGLNASAMRSSTGYAFSQIMGQVMDLIKNIDETTHTIKAKPGSTKLETLMDKILLNVLSKSPEKAPEIFSTVLESLTGDEFAKFMTGYCPTSVKSKIINSFPKPLFLRAAVMSIFE